MHSIQSKGCIFAHVMLCLQCHRIDSEKPWVGSLTFQLEQFQQLPAVTGGPVLSIAAATL